MEANNGKKVAGKVISTLIQQVRGGVCKSMQKNVWGRDMKSVWINI
jgi:hypothetical protein